MRNKKGVELSINFTVMLVLAIAVFILGLVFVTKLFSKAEDIKLGLDVASENEMKAILSGGKDVAVYPSRVNIKNNHYDTIGIAVVNKLSTNEQFHVGLTFVQMVNDNVVICDTTNQDDCHTARTGWCVNEQYLITDGILNPCGAATVGALSTATINANEQKDFLFGINIPSESKKGLYVFDVTTTYGAGPIVYRSPQRVYVSVT